MIEEKPFEYIELKAMCLLCATYSAIYVAEGKFKDPFEGRKHIESEVERIINIHWLDPEKITIKSKSDE